MAPVFHSPYSLYKKPLKDGREVWYARFWNPEALKYTVTRSLNVEAIGKRERKPEAERAARELLPSITFKPKSAKALFVDYIESFWTPESPYVIDHAEVLKKPLSAYYVKMNHDDVARHVRPFPGFKKKKLAEVKKATLLAWRRWAIGKGLSGRRVNTVLQSMRVAIRYAVEVGDLVNDPFKGLGKVPEGEGKEKGILTAAELTAILALDVPDVRIKVAVLLGARCGLRRGEVRGLQWGDIDAVAGMIHVRHNYINAEGLKAPKRGSARRVPVSKSVIELLEAVGAMYASRDAGAYVFASLDEKREPLTENYYRRGLETILELVGIDAEARKARNLTFHGLRHTFVTLGRMAGLADIEIQALAGHKSAAMMERYSHASQVIDFTKARDAMEAPFEPVSKKAKKPASGA